MFSEVSEAGVSTALDLCVPDPDSDAGRVDWVQVLGQALPFVDVFAPSIEELLFMFDPPAHERLQAAGVAEVRDVAACTICDERFFSHRREGVRAGRQAGVAWLS